jgi:soluble lytic murein transglycosylase-like protein
MLSGHSAVPCRHIAPACQLQIGSILEGLARMRRFFVGGFPFRFWRALTASAALWIAALHGAQAASSTEPAPQAPQVKVLSPQDAARYEKIFALQDKAAFDAADREIADLDDMVLMGHVLFQRYTQPTYRARYDELKRWLLVYADHPGAARIYTLALKRKPRSAASPNRPEPRVWRQATGEGLDELAPRRETGATRKIFSRVRSLVRDERPSQALSYLEQPDIKRALGQDGVDEAMRYIANSYFAEGVDDKAYAIAADVAARNASDVPMANWTAGLAAWRMGKRDLAAQHFERLANASAVPPATRAAGAFWAARGYLAIKQPERVTPLLEIAAASPRSFYGVLATRQLGRPLAFDWRVPDLDQASYERLIAVPAVERAVALVEAGQRDLAEEELARAHGRMPASLDQAMLALADRLSMPAVALQVAEGLPDMYDGGRYPVPDYAPAGGFKLDPALLYAFMHQESKFQTDAESHAGAQGLMQLMPRTASHVAGDRALIKRERDRLLDPSFNLEIAQRYLRDLMQQVEPVGNLFMLAVAYNGGPGNLRRWRDKLGIDDDPLLFVESIPSAETRGYIERVLTNYWAYRDRLGEGSASLDQTAAGAWPIYTPGEIRNAVQR